jgi:hypothetical protein
MNAAEYSPLITVVYTSVHGNREADHLQSALNDATTDHGNRPKQRSALRLVEPELTLRSAWRRFRLIDLVRLLARRAAREVYEEQMNGRRAPRS